MNIGGIFATGPAEAAFVIDELVKPASVIASHANEEATSGGKVKPGSKTAQFIEAAGVPVHLPLSDRTMAFDGRSEEHTSELQSLMRTSYDVFCLKQKKFTNQYTTSSPYISNHNNK